MHPLCVTFSPPVYSQIGWRNLRTFIDSGFDHYLVSPGGKINRALTKLGFILLGDHNEIFDHGQGGAPFRVALHHKVKLVMYGENAEAEYGGTMMDASQPGRNWEDFEVYFSNSVDNLLKIGIEDGYITEEIKKMTMDIYMLPPAEELRKAKVEMHWWGYYNSWIPQENYYYAAEHTGFQANPEGHTIGTYSKYAQLDDQTDSFLYYMMYIKFGIGRATSDAAHEIRDGHITRDEAIALVRRYDGEFPQKDFQLFLDYVDLTESEFWEVVDRFRLPHIWKKENGVWKLRHAVYDEIDEEITHTRTP
jgi:N-acetyl sugar amidotransferase